MIAQAAPSLILRKLPKVPSTIPIYKTSVTTTTDETTSTFAGIDIGVAHPKRIVIACVYHGVVGGPTATCNGIPGYRISNAGHEGAVFVFLVPTGTTATITVTMTGSLRKAVSVYIAYPYDPLPLDSGTSSATTTTAAAVNSFKVQKNGFFIYNGVVDAGLVTFSTTWGGGDTPTENVDAQLEAVGSYTAGLCLNTVSSDASNFTMSASVSSTKRLVAASWRPAYGND